MGIKCMMGFHDWHYAVETPHDDFTDVFLTGDEPLRHCSKCMRQEWLLSHCLGGNPFTLANTWIEADYRHLQLRTNPRPNFTLTERDFQAYMLLIDYHFLHYLERTKTQVRKHDVDKLARVEKKLFNLGVDPKLTPLEFKECIWKRK